MGRSNRLPSPIRFVIETAKLPEAQARLSEAGVSYTVQPDDRRVDCSIILFRGDGDEVTRTLGLLDGLCALTGYVVTHA